MIEKLRSGLKNPGIDSKFASTCPSNVLMSAELLCVMTELIYKRFFMFIIKIVFTLDKLPSVILLPYLY